MIRVLIVDDQELFAAGIEIILKGPGSDGIEVVGIAGNGKEAVQQVARLKPDVVLMDVRMPEMDGVQATQLIADRHPSVKVLMLTTFDDDRFVLDALHHGALGYVLKDISAEDLITSINAVNNGNFFVSPTIGHKLVDRAEESHRENEGASMHFQGEINFLLSCFDTLTNREAEILHLVMLDRDNVEIAEELKIAEQTVKNKITTIYDKLGVPDRIHARRHVRTALEQRTPH